MSEILQIFQHSPPSHQQMPPHFQRGVLHVESEFNRFTDSGFPSPGIFDVTVQSSDQLDGNPFMDFSSSSVDELSKVTAVIGRNQRLKKKRKLEESNSTDSKPDYIHVRARRGEATDTHSLAERARREKIKKKMQYLQDLVPGCNKLNNKAAILDEIITYIQSLQIEIEFLTIKLAALTTSHVLLEDGQFLIA